MDRQTDPRKDEDKNILMHCPWGGEPIEPFWKTFWQEKYKAISLLAVTACK